MIDKPDLSELPRRWVWTKLENIAEINPRLPEDDYPIDLQVTFIPMKAVEELSGKIDLNEDYILCSVSVMYFGRCDNGRENE